jgi:hypothetical protein
MSEKELIKISFYMGEASCMINEAIGKLEKLENEVYNLITISDKKKMNEALGLLRSANDLFEVFNEDERTW